MIPLIRVVKFIQTAGRMMVTREVKMGRSYYLMGTVSVWEDEIFLEMHDDDGCKTMWRYLMPLNCTIINVSMVNFMLHMLQQFKKIK